MCVRCPVDIMIKTFVCWIDCECLMKINGTETGRDHCFCLFVCLFVCFLIRIVYNTVLSGVESIIGTKKCSLLSMYYFSDTLSSHLDNVANFFPNRPS